jgi:hypothetical protein
MKSKVDVVAPNRTKDRTDMELPKVKKLKADNDSPTRINERKDTFEPTLA